MLISVLKTGNTVAAVFRSEEKMRKALRHFSPRVISVQTAMVRSEDRYAKPAIVANSKPARSRDMHSPVFKFKE